MIILKGIIIGIGKIIPGVSGSMLAISMGLYEKLINCFCNLKEKSNIIFLIKFCCGVLISIILFSNIILNLLHNYYLISISLFVGLILGGINEIISNINKKNYFLIFFIFIIMSLIGVLNLDNNFIINNKILKIFYYFIAGIIETITMIVPGISGTATLMMYGCYEELLYSISNIFKISNIFNNIIILFPFVVGMIIGLIGIIKIINYLLENHKNVMYNIILGFCVSTIFVMIINGFKVSFEFSDIAISIILFTFGYILSKKINYYFSNN